MKALKKYGFTLIELMIVVAIIGILAALAIPNFLKFQARSKVGECKANLKGFYTAQKGYFQEHDTYGNYFDQIGFSPERGNRFVYRADQGGDKTAQARNIVTLNTTVSNIDVIQADQYKFPAVLAQQPKNANASTTTLSADTGHTALTVTGENAVVTTGTNGDFQGSCDGDIDNETTGIETLYVSSQGGLIKVNAKSCVPNVATEIQIPEGTPAVLYDDVDCDN